MTAIPMVTIVNTHTKENPDFTVGLSEFVAALGIECRVIPGYEETKPPARRDSHVILSGVPLDVPYSLEDAVTRREVDRAFGWLREHPGPVLGICFGHEILAHIFGGVIASFDRLVRDARCHLRLSLESDRGVFSDIEECEVFAEHLQYVSAVPDTFNVLSERSGIPYIVYRPEREMYGVQFVPERSDSRCKDALRRFLEA